MNGVYYVVPVIEIGQFEHTLLKRELEFQKGKLIRQQDSLPENPYKLGP